MHSVKAFVLSSHVIYKLVAFRLIDDLLLT